MAFDAHANLASSLVVTPPSPATSGTSLTVTAGQGALFPAVPFNCTVCPAATFPTTTNAEIVRVTAIVGDTFTITRAQESTTAKAILTGYFIGNSITVKVLTDIENAIGAGSIGITDDTTTSATMYPVWVTATNGALPGYVSSTELTFNPGTGLLTSPLIRVGPVGFGSVQPMELVGSDCGLALTSTNTGLSAETYLAGFMKNASGNYQKLGAESFRWADDNATTGYATWNIHTTAYTAGVAADYFGFAFAAKHGATLFASSTAAATFPGDGILKIFGSLVTTGGINIAATATFSSTMTQSYDGGNTTGNNLAIRNTNAGNAATTRLILGNNASAGSATFASYSSNHATLPNYVTIFNEFNAPLILGVNGVECIRITGTALTTTGTIELGAATDTTLARVSAGVVSIEGVTIATASNTLTLTAKTLTDAVNNISAPGVTTVGYLGVPQNSQSTAYTTVLADCGKEIYHPVGDTNNRIFTIDSNANVAAPIGTVIIFTNMSPNNVTISITSDTLFWFGTGATGSRTLAQYGTAAARKLTSTSWGISGTNLT